MYHVCCLYSATNMKFYQWSYTVAKMFNCWCRICISSLKKRTEGYFLYSGKLFSQYCNIVGKKVKGRQSSLANPVTLCQGG